ncbi:hypothetical protein HK20_09175 [Acetobacter sp. DsW_54]|nr:hypothetical protein HK20_09175 [Acetobacter sp. DsW_54]
MVGHTLQNAGKARTTHALLARQFDGNAIFQQDMADRILISNREALTRRSKFYNKLVLGLAVQSTCRRRTKAFTVQLGRFPPCFSHTFFQKREKTIWPAGNDCYVGIRSQETLWHDLSKTGSFITEIKRGHIF